MANKLHINDMVVVITGKDKGKTGHIKSFKKTQYVLIEGINFVKKHNKPNPKISYPGGIVQQEAYIHISNIAIFNNQTGKSDRIGFKIQKNKKIRFLKSNHVNIDDK
ncbi:50S ribosomal protein L24 [Enterobacteriaceae endosymbiont of Macroplea appendiculata]|uniref:50S ribosomal protein L24 n=1 Tax=Enterobacteriaceae endosymbiont of Macroplea appendiculata TaxID=2675790 RepID=UPI0014498F0A|nr:50S ribosomal protein L24 [Enterobacteriaceae endosymbiont of Macroplea appendiculata]QJC30875.1 50S ribosomal protein L24 [Enterobacteriaceae endosymbiont of Macroplea appendiculata]